MIHRISTVFATAAALLLVATDAAAVSLVTVKQFGSAGNDVANDRVVSSGVYVAGQTTGAFGGQSNAGKVDAFLVKQKTGGGTIWTRIFGTGGKDRAFAVDSDSSGVYVVGSTGGTLPGQTREGRTDAFIRKYDTTGTELWTRQFGTSGKDEARGVVIAPSGDVYVGGTTTGALPGQTATGAGDAFVRKYSASGNELWTRQFGSTNGVAERVSDVAADSGGVYVAGRTAGRLPGQTPKGGVDGFIRKYNHSGDTQWIRQFGTAENDQANGIDVDSGLLYAAGDTRGVFPGQPQKAGLDAFVRVWNTAGVKQWTRQFGTLEDESAAEAAADGTGVTLAGWTAGAFRNQVNAGGKDAFARRYNTTGQGQWLLEFGGGANDVGLGVDTTSTTALVSGSTTGAMPGQTSKGGTDAFIANIA